MFRPSNACRVPGLEGKNLCIYRTAESYLPTHTEAQAEAAAPAPAEAAPRVHALADPWDPEHSKQQLAAAIAAERGVPLRYTRNPSSLQLYSCVHKDIPCVLPLFTSENACHSVLWRTAAAGGRRRDAPWPRRYIRIPARAVYIRIPARAVYIRIPAPAVYIDAMRPGRAGADTDAPFSTAACAFSTWLLVLPQRLLSVLAQRLLVLAHCTGTG